MAFECFVVTANPVDYPGKVVVRRHLSRDDGSLVPNADPLVVADDITRARLALPAGLSRFDRDLYDDPVIVEWWAAPS